MRAANWESTLNPSHETSPFERLLREDEFAENTVETYSFAVRDFLARYKKPSRASMADYKASLINTYKPTITDGSVPIASPG